MFLDPDRMPPPQEPWQPERPHHRLSPQAGRVIGWIIGLNIIMLLVGPLAGASIFDAMAVLLHAAP